MKKDNVTKEKEFVVLPERLHFQSMLAKNANYFGNVPNSKLKANYVIVSNTNYEEISCVGYNPDTRNLEATFSIKRSSGYLGSLCSNGSLEHVRFYIDFHDGAGFIDQGAVAVNLHDIPNSKDCNGKSIFPIMYTATLKTKTSKFSMCQNPILPTVKAILSWNQEPPADTPNWPPVWGNVVKADIQLKPLMLIKEISDDFSKFLEYAVDFPDLSTKELTEISGIDIAKLKPQPESLQLDELIKRSVKVKVPATRFAYKSVYKMMKYPTSKITMMEKTIFDSSKIKVSSLIDEFIKIPIDKSKANIDYEELDCIGLDYNIESLVATFSVKKKYGFSGDLCDDGSNEYIAFWVDWDNDCNWEYLDTVKINVHDIQMKGDCLNYSVSLPLDTTYRKKICSEPNVIRIRGVLSWNIAPSITDPNKLQYYGNRIDAHVQIKPGTEIEQGDVIPLFNIIGGIDVDHVNDVTGLTKPGSFFAFNGKTVPNEAPFGGVVVLNGPTFSGERYKIKITNLNTGTVTYPANSFIVVGHLTHAPWVQYTTQSVDPEGYYHFLAPEKNTLNVLARFTPGTNDKFQVELKVDTVPGVFTKTIQMDNIIPELKLSVDDGDDCTYYKKGDPITGHFYVNDLHIKNWEFKCRWGGNLNGTANTPALPGQDFSIPTAANAYPCGSVSLYAKDKTIINSQSIGFEKRASYAICLQDK